MKYLHVVAALIQDEDGKILLVDKEEGEKNTIRIPPGGKIDDGETEVDALIRELNEELQISDSDILKIDNGFCGVTGTLNGKHIRVTVYKVKLKTGVIFETHAEVKNPKYYTPEQILHSKITTEATKNLAYILQ